MFDVNVVDFLTQNMVDPVFNTMREYAASSWTDYTKNASLLAATGIIVEDSSSTARPCPSRPATGGTTTSLAAWRRRTRARPP
jgi:hypothetical protein